MYHLNHFHVYSSVVFSVIILLLNIQDEHSHIVKLKLYTR